MDTYICEKPSQGADLAKVLAQGKPVSKQKGCIYGSNNSWCVTWGVGHLLELPKPEEFDPERWGSWTLASLPIMPETWRWKVNSRTADQFKLVKEILKKTKTAYIATDFGREGEAIGRSLLDECNFKGQVRRVVLRSLDPKSIEKALSSILGGEATIPLYHSALARSRADYLVGMNLTRLYTVLGQMIGYKETLNIGRVLTPIVNLVVERDLAIKIFVKSPYWTLNTTVTTASGSFIAKWQPEAHCDSEGRCVNAQHAQTIQRALSTVTNQLCSMSTELTKKEGLLWTAFANAKPPTVDCPLCAAEMHRIKGSNGFFWACQAEKDKCGKTFNDVKGKPDLGAKASTTGVTGSAKEKDAPFCDECGKPMVLRKGKPNGAKRASSFWSCSGYPTCKCTMPVKKK